uniref:50S ribosomal protein L20 n=1 Tax=Nephromyces sp. ex Molgula occidentalis TaxID=2544991 RepID=A0A5C1H7J0_9APIC|nr:hypothetical protein [Nephromyces sp. ex Molgula occidentalis]
MISFFNLKNKQLKQKYLKAGKSSYKHRKQFLRINYQLSNLNKILKLKNYNYSRFKNQIKLLNILLNTNYQYLLLDPLIFNLLFKINKKSNNLILKKIISLINFYI